MIFKNRYDAAMQLIPRLEKYQNEAGVVMAIPRGGVPIGYYIAKKFNFPLEIILTKKIGHPLNKELAIGAVSLDNVIIDKEFDISGPYIESQVKQIQENLKERYKSFMGNRHPTDIKGKTVILADDGVATGATILSAIEVLRAQQPRMIIVAVPVSSIEAATKISKACDDLICPVIPENLIAVSRFYQDFSEVSDDDVFELLNEF